MLITLLTIAVVCITFLVAFYRLWNNPPKLEVSVSLRDLHIPDSFRIEPSFTWEARPLQVALQVAQTTQMIPADVEVKPKEEPIPEEILDYIEQESESHARDARRRRVRALKADTGSWDVAFRLLQREDNGEY